MTRKPHPHMPAVISISGSVGTYVVISPRGEGMNPGTIRPRPLSIHMATNVARQPRKSRGSLLLVPGLISRINAIATRVNELHAHGTRLDLPERPKRRYSTF